MVEKSPKLLWGAIAFAIYFTLVGLLIFYFNTRSEDKSKHYVKKDEHRIQVALINPKKEKISKGKSKPKVKPTPPKVKKKPKPKVKKEPKVKPKVKDTKKKVIKEKIVKKVIKKQNINLVKPKRKKQEKQKKKSKKTKDLFSTVKTKTKSKKIEKPIEKNKKESKKNVLSASARISKSLHIQKAKDSGIKNAYFTKVHSLLETWPAQSEYAGEKAVVRIFVKPTGKFEFKVQTQSNNIAFNHELVAFLKQLQRIGLGRHDAGRTYEFNVEFIAKE